jgi:hypothetical protein
MADRMRQQTLSAIEMADLVLFVIDAKDGVTAYLQNCLFVRKGEKIAGGGGPDNSQVFGGFAGYSDYDPLANAPSSEGMDKPADPASQF